MTTLFNDGLGRTISRDPAILPKLADEYRRSSLMLLATAGIEIEYLQAQVTKLEQALNAQRNKEPIPVRVAPPVPAVKVAKAASKKE